VKPEEAFALFYFGSGVAAILLPDAKPDYRPRTPIFPWIILALGCGPLALWIAWTTRQENLRDRDAKRQFDQDRRNKK
jgi:hypothetical protein